ncbi:hypothetical protein ACRALDRAFT_2017518 [Sodiomyces alcalophilus JCM 7366]|uniref:uncharacterized protein n=1 Tax=Sodiomyces alcalophilus JCM 7366 TaxID=591952 RepID=UPI0039B3D07B
MEENEEQTVLVCVSIALQHDFALTRARLSTYSHPQRSHLILYVRCTRSMQSNLHKLVQGSVQDSRATPRRRRSKDGSIKRHAMIFLSSCKFIQRLPSSFIRRLTTWVRSYKYTRTFNGQQKAKCKVYRSPGNLILSAPVPWYVAQSRFTPPFKLQRMYWGTCKAIYHPVLTNRSLFFRGMKVVTAQYLYIVAKTLIFFHDVPIYVEMQKYVLCMQKPSYFAGSEHRDYSYVHRDGSYVHRDGSYVHRDGSYVHRDGSYVHPVPIQIFNTLLKNVNKKIPASVVLRKQGCDRGMAELCTFWSF